MNRLGKIATVFLTMLPLSLAALDIGASVGVASSSGSHSLNDTNVWPSLNASIGTSVSDSVYINLDLTDSVGFATTSVSDATLTASWSADFGTLGLLGAWQWSSTSHPDLGIYANTSFPLMGDLATVELAAVVKYDLNGVFGELRAGPAVYLPLATPVFASLTVIQNFLTSGYAGRAYTGLSTLTLQPQVTVSLSSDWGLSASGGYTFDVSGGQFPSFPFAGAKISWSYGN